MQSLVVIVLSLIFLIGPVSAEAKNKKTYTCAAYCRFSSIEGIKREEMNKSGTSMQLAWKQLKAACLQEEAAELQVHNDKFTTCSKNDSEKACNEPEFFEATQALACHSVSKSSK